MSARPDDAPIVTLYGRTGCHLCEDAAALLSRLAPELGFHWRSVDIDADPALLALYDQVVPVIALDGHEIARAPIRPADLRERLQHLTARCAG
jgi:glutaredoxin